ncbi:peptidoglycan DD-metalloendopeptidase family protein [Microbacterium sp.]|uniref:peptidoglycan DD-metalloendopeptidase family protein n=1 Tax=Microbacterium sp. TaxID=51671 RepID=UPI003C72081E
MEHDEPVLPSDCGCAPTPREHRALQGPVSRRMALGLGGVGILSLGALGLAIAPTAFAADYPSWDDVQRAKNDEAAKATEVARIQGLIASLQADVAAKQAEADRLAGEYLAAQEAFEAAADNAASLQAQADAEAERAQATAEKLGRLAAQQYRAGADDAALELFFSGSAASADDLLAKLGTMDRLVEANRGVYADAVSARDNATNLYNQAQVARDERDRLQKEAEQKMVAAQDAAVAAQAALDAQTENLGTLQAQLAALQDTTTKTIADYQAGVEAARKAEEARKAAEAEARRKAAEDAAAAAAASSGGSRSAGGGGGTGGEAGTGDWVRPTSGYISSWFGNRGTICGNGVCVTGHRGIDFATACWSPIYAVTFGRVVYAAWGEGWGNYIKVDHGDGTITGYAHIANGGYNVSYGQSVSRGQLIAYVGNTGASTGCHLHFEVYEGGVRVDPAPVLLQHGVNVY